MHIETEFEELLERLEPGCRASWLSASPDEIEEFETLAKHRIPPFYRWFLESMGRSMGALINPRRDMSLTTVLSIYRGGFSPPDPNLLLIGSEPDEVMPAYLYYDSSKQTRGDAWVCNYHPRGGPRQDDFETLREMLAWGIFIKSWRRSCPQRCAGTLIDEQRDPLAKLEPVLGDLGFVKVLEAGPFCGLYEGPQAAMSCTVTPGDCKKRHLFFQLFGGGAAAHRSILGTIGVETSLEIEIREWTPRLPS